MPLDKINRPRTEEKDQSGKSPDNPWTNRENPGKIEKVPTRDKKSDKKRKTVKKKVKSACGAVQAEAEVDDGAGDL